MATGVVNYLLVFAAGVGIHVLLWLLEWLFMCYYGCCWCGQSFDIMAASVVNYLIVK